MATTRLFRPLSGLLRQRSGVVRLVAARSPLSTAARTQSQEDSGSKKPQWLEQIIQDKRTFFEDVSHVEKAFLSEAAVDYENQKIVLTYPNAPDSKFRNFDVNFVALRQSCRCEKCFNPGPQQRRMDYINVDLTEKPKEVKMDQENQLLHVTWASDGHKSQFSGPWLYASFTPHPLYQRPNKKIWRTDDFLAIQSKEKVDYNDVVTKPESMLKFLVNLATYGLVKVTNAPRESGVLKDLSSLLNYARKTHYGFVLLLNSISQFFFYSNQSFLVNFSA